LSSDPGLQLVSALQSQLQVEPEWCVPLDRGFQWWPGHLSQRVWADPLKQVGSHEFSRLHIESDLPWDAELSGKVRKFTAWANRLSTVSSLLFNPDDGCIRLHASLCVCEDDLKQTVRLATMIASMQAAEASAKAISLAEALGVTPIRSAHPTHGMRESEHMALGILHVLAAQNEELTPASELDFSALEHLDPCPWVLASGDKGGLTAEFAFLSKTTGMHAATSGDPVGTALLQLSTDCKHPQLGDGVLIRLKLPLDASPDLTNALNLLEARDGANNADQLGAWCEDKNGPVFVTFVPTCLLERDWLVTLIYDNAIRTRWAKGLLVEAKEA
jgi:hypothetical protein